MNQNLKKNLENYFPTVMKLLAKHRNISPKESQEKTNIKKNYAALESIFAVQLLIAKQRLSPLIGYFNRLNPREKILTIAASIVLLVFLLNKIIMQPYLNFRQNVIKEQQVAFEEYKWLKSHEDRVKNLFLISGGFKLQNLNIKELALKYEPTAKVEELADGKYLITMSNHRGVKFLNFINILVNRGVLIESVELYREEKHSVANFIAKIKI